MRHGLVLFAVAACGGGDDRSDTSFATGVSTVNPGTTAGTTGGSESSTGTPGSASTSTTAADTSTQTTVDPVTTAVDTLDPSTTETGAVGCPALGGEDCSPGPGSGEPDTCIDGTTCFIDLVQEGVQAVIAAHPEWFDVVDPTLVLDAESYMNAVVAEVGTKGVCIIRDPNAGDEVAVKHDNAFAESFDILSADGHARYGELIYTATCSPAWF